MGLEERLKRLEDKASTNSEWVVPIEVRLLTKTVARHHALQDSKEPPPYTQEEIEAMRQDDLEIVAGGGVVGECRNNSKGWESEEARELLATWEEDAHRRVEAGKDLPPELWHRVWADENEYEEG